MIGVRANQRLAATALRGAALYGTDTTIGSGTQWARKRE